MTSITDRLRDLFTQPNGIYAKPVTRRIVLGVAFFFLFMIVLSADIIPDKVTVQVGQVSDRDIVAPRTASYVDTAKTKKLEAEVLASVANVYDLDVRVLAKAEESVSAIFGVTKSMLADKSLVTKEQKVEKLKSTLPIALSNMTLSAITQLDEASLEKTQEQTLNILRKYFQRGAREDDLDIARKQIVLETEELVENKNMEAVVAGIAQQLLQPNFILNVRETDKRKQTALATIEPVRETVKKGQVIVRRGDVISNDQIHTMEELGMYKGQIGELRILGLTVFVLTVMASLLGYLYKFSPQIYENDVYLVLLGLIVLLALVLGKIAHFYSDFAAPLAIGSLLTAILIDARLALFVSVAISMLFGVIVEYDLRAVATVLVGSMVGVYSVSKLTHGYSLTKTGIWIATVNFLVVGATGLMQQVEATQLLIQGMLGVFSGIGSAVITTGLLPYLENSFNITTPIKLLDLAQSNHPLLQRLLMEAPGTYHHSILVGNLAEAAADVIGADPVTVRVGAYYHDIGKIKRPYFFVENQVGIENPHDKIAPSLSTLIVTSHIKDGIDLCRDYKIPQVIIDIVQQHHGTMLVSFFYNRATENEHGDCIVEADFRYEGPRPQSKEAALIMLADACEAAVRSLSKPNVNRIEAMVRKIIRERLHDGQLDECNLTLRDLSIIGDVYIRILSSMFHTRIEYPDALKELERRKFKSGNCIKQLAGKTDDNASSGTGNDVSARKDS